MSASFTLASASPRRRDLLEGAGYCFRVQPFNVDERMHIGEEPVAYAARLASAKAQGQGLVIGADTVVHWGDQVLGKPKDSDEAVTFLEKLSGGGHWVTTGVCLREGELEDLFTVSTQVFFRELGEQEIRDYVAGGEPMDKAGAYGIQASAASFVERIAGSYTNVVGLPLAETVQRLAAKGVFPRRTRK